MQFTDEQIDQIKDTTDLLTLRYIENLEDRIVSLSLSLASEQCRRTELEGQLTQARDLLKQMQQPLAQLIALQEERII